LKYRKCKMFSLKVKDKTKGVIVAIITAFLFGYILLPLICVNLTEPVIYAIDKAWITNCHAKVFMLMYVPDTIGFGFSGLLMGLFIGFVSKKNRVFTIILSILIIIAIYFIFLITGIPEIPQDLRGSVIIRLVLGLLLRFVFLSGFTFLGVWLVSRKNRKSVQRSLQSESAKDDFTF
jgi:hypothetical protein